MKLCQKIPEKCYFVKEYFEVIRNFLTHFILEKMSFGGAFESMLASAEMCGQELTSYRFWDSKSPASPLQQKC